MKTYYICAALVFLASYSVFHFGFRAGGDAQLYRINDSIAFELHEPNEHTNGIAVRGYRPTNVFVKFICGACEIDSRSEVDMVNVNYRNGDYVYTDFPQHDKAHTDIVNLRTGETINANVPADFKYKDDLSKLAEYKTLGLAADERFRLNQDYVKANFKPLSTFTNRCVGVNIIFCIFALFLIFPNMLFWIISAIVRSNDPNDPANYLSNQ